MELGGPQVGELTRGGSPRPPALTCKRDHIRTKDYMDRWVTPRNRVSSPTWGPPPPCKQALSAMIFLWIFSATLLTSALWVGYLNKI